MRRLGRDDGMSLIEVLVAATILLVGIMSLTTVFTSATELTSNSKRESQAVDFGQRQLESLRALPYASVTMSSCAGGATWTSFMTPGSSSHVKPLGEETMACDATNGRIAPSETWSDDVTATRGTVYRYVTQPAADVRRIVVVVTVQGAGALNDAVTVAGIKPNPDAGSAGGSYLTGSGSPCDVVIGIVCQG